MFPLKPQRLAALAAALFIITLLIGASLAPAAPSADAAPVRQADPADILVIAHQGGDGLRPSNTMAAFEYAAALGVDMLEMDIHATRDGVIVVIHDDSVNRTTDGEGMVKEMTFEEIQQLDAGYNWPTLGELADVEGYPFRGQGITIPALEEVLAAFPDYLMTIEIKQAEPSIVGPFCALLREYEKTDEVIVASFHQKTLDEFRAECPEVATSAGEGEVRAAVGLAAIGRMDAYMGPEVLQVPVSAEGVEIVTADFVAVMHEAGIQVQVWTPNTVDELTPLIEMGAHGLITDFPDLALELLGREVPEVD